MILPSITSPDQAARFDESYLDWVDGELIQNALGWLTVDEREFVKYGTTDPVNDWR